MSRKKVLVLGAGLVARPLIRYLLDKGFILTVASPFPKIAGAFINGHENGSALEWNINEEDVLQQLLESHDIAVSLLPAPFHPKVARACLAAGRHMVTASYVSPEMSSLDEEAQRAGLIFLNEVGVDPGIDHMSIMKIIDELREKGGKVTLLRSCCGGLPAPESNNNPLGYKFSWSPAGVLVAMTGPAIFLENSQRVDLPTGGLFDYVRHTKVGKIGELEYYPNRDSLGYLDIYGVKDISTMFRGTFRYPGWVRFWKIFWQIGLLDRTPRKDLATKSTSHTWKKILGDLVGLAHGGDLLRTIAEKTETDEDDEVFEHAKWLGLFDETPVSNAETLLDCVADLLFAKMTYSKGERDMLIMKHDFEAVYPDGSLQEITSLMLDYGLPDGDSSMARTVGLPAAIAVRLILENQITVPGVQIPVAKEIYGPILAELENYDIRLEENYKSPLP